MHKTRKNMETCPLAYLARLTENALEEAEIEGDDDD